jgi:hypothetical protein
LAALVGFGKLMLDEQGFVPVPLEGWLFGVAGSLATLFGARYVWDLYDGLIAFRKSASDIVQPLKHPVFEGVKNPAPRNRRDRLFPWVVTVIQFVALGLALWYFGARWRLPVVGALACGAAAAVALALWRWWRATHPEDDS